MADAPLTGNYPELPEPQGSKMLSFATAGDIPGWILYVKQYARAAIDADRAARSDPPSPPVAGPRPVTPYTCPECHALWLHWPAEQSGFGMDTLNCRSTTHCDYCEKGGVEQLRRLERVPATLSAPAAGAVAGPDLQPLHNLLYTAQRTTGEARDNAINAARLELARLRAGASRPSTGEWK